MCSVQGNLEEMDALSFCLAKFIQEMANKKDGRYRP